MVFVIVQIRSGATILKIWYGCSIPEGSSLADVYTSFSSGQLDHGLPIPEEYQDSTVVVKVGKSRSDLIIVSIECSVAEVVSNLGQYMDFAVGTGIQGAVQDQPTARPVSRDEVGKKPTGSSLCVVIRLLMQSVMMTQF